MSAAISNTLIPPLIRPYPPRQKMFHICMPHTPNGTVFEEYSIAKKHIVRLEREILVLVYGYCDFPKRSVHGFPSVADPADRIYRYLA
jgi:histidinol-phosphate/aromatic aminotransferase/cobyric acid decarboxylase-like protein